MKKRPSGQPEEESRLPPSGGLMAASSSEEKPVEATQDLGSTDHSQMGTNQRHFQANKK